MEDTADAAALDAMLVRLSEMVARRLRDHASVCAHGADQAALFRFLHLHAVADAGSRHADRYRNWPRRRERFFTRRWNGKPIRLLGVYAQSLEASEGQTSLLEEPRPRAGARRWAPWIKIRDKYGDDGIVSLAAGMKAAFRARVHENPENLPGKDPKSDPKTP